MPSGICILFYGSAGTGKTESVLQLAKKTGRAIRQVDMSSIKDKWVGESEKNVKAIFDEYRYACNNAQAKPILLLNEADAIITKRVSVERTVDQMSNAIQNIFLEEMEKFDGILIATSNLQNNFDPAFDRRFLFKVEFDKPSVEIRAQIIMDRIPTISINDAKYLAMKYELSGGQVENVARKAVTELLLSGKNPDCSIIEKFCNEEKGFRESGIPRGKIGFVHPITK
jgi:SpoVK/Ycf46/Vps4 family AAA+-type ATPase